MSPDSPGVPTHTHPDHHRNPIFALMRWPNQTDGWGWGTSNMFSQILLSFQNENLEPLPRWSCACNWWGATWFFNMTTNMDKLTQFPQFEPYPLLPPSQLAPSKDFEELLLSWRSACNWGCSPASWSDQQLLRGKSSSQTQPTTKASISQLFILSRLFSTPFSLSRFHVPCPLHLLCSLSDSQHLNLSPASFLRICRKATYPFRGRHTVSFPRYSSLFSLRFW